MAKIYGRGGTFNIASADSMGIKPMSLDPGRPGGPIRPDDPSPIDGGQIGVNPVDPETPPEEAPQEEKPTPEEEGQSIADGIGFEGVESDGSILDNYSFLGFVALAAIGITLVG